MLVQDRGFAEKSRSMASRTAKEGAWLDIAAMTALLLSYMWVWQRTFPGELFVCIGLVVGLAVWSHWRRGETPRDLGFRTDNLVPAAIKVFSFVGPLIVVILLVGVCAGHRFASWLATSSWPGSLFCHSSAWHSSTCYSVSICGDTKRPFQEIGYRSWLRP